MSVSAASSKLAYGGGPLGNLAAPVSHEDGQQSVTQALALGVRHFDTAPHYGRGLSERRLGDALRGQKGFTISSKVGRILRPAAEIDDDTLRDGFRSAMPFRVEYDYSGDGILRSHEASLHRLGLARIDLLLIHDIGTMTHGADNERYWNQLIEGGGLGALERLRDDDVVGGIGLGVNEIEACLALMDRARLDTILLAGRYTLLDQSALDGLLDACLAAGTRVLLGAPFNSGILATGTGTTGTIWYDYAPAGPTIVDRVRGMEALADEYRVPLAAAALQFPLGHPAVGGVVAGFRTAAQVEQAAAWMQHDIPADFWTEMKDRKLLRADAPVPAPAGANP
jgi:D-threo-aldose 1-dehydrogenase